MRVLVVARRDSGGSWYHLASQLRHRQVAQVRVVTLESDPALRWPTDLAQVYDGGQELAELIRTADLFHCVDVAPDELSLLGGAIPQRCQGPKPARVVLQCDEGPAPARARWLTELAGERGWSVVTTRPAAPELSTAKFMAPFIPMWRAPWIPQHRGTRLRVRKPDRIVFACTSRSLRERRRLESLIDRAERRAQELHGARVDIVENRGHAQVLQRRRRAHLVLTASQGGLGRGALEALGQGIATVADLEPADLEAWTRVAGGTAPPVVPSSELDHLMEALSVDTGPDLALRQWAMHVTDPRRWFSLCERIWRTGAVDRAA